MWLKFSSSVFGVLGMQGFFTQRSQNKKPATVVEAGRAVDVAVSLYGRGIAIAQNRAVPPRGAASDHRGAKKNEPRVNRSL